MKALEAVERLKKMRESMERLKERATSPMIKTMASQDGQALNFAISLIESVLYGHE